VIAVPVLATILHTAPLKCLSVQQFNFNKLFHHICYP